MRVCFWDFLWEAQGLPSVLLHIQGLGAFTPTGASQVHLLYDYRVKYFKKFKQLKIVYFDSPQKTTIQDRSLHPRIPKHPVCAHAGARGLHFTLGDRC